MKAELYIFSWYDHNSIKRTKILITDDPMACANLFDKDCTYEEFKQEGYEIEIKDLKRSNRPQVSEQVLLDTVIFNKDIKIEFYRESNNAYAVLIAPSLYVGRFIYTFSLNGCEKFEVLFELQDHIIFSYYDKSGNKFSILATIKGHVVEFAEI